MSGPEEEDIMMEDGGWDPVMGDSPMDVLNTLNSPENIEMKTEINNVPGMAGIKTVSEFLRSKGFEEVADQLDNYLETHFKYMVSYRRQGRGEIVGAVSHQNTPQISIRERLFADLKE